MRILCPNCNAEFIVNDNLIGPKGKKLKCSRCSYIWLARYQEDLIEQVVQDVGVNTKIHNLPAVVPSRSFRSFYVVACAMLLFVSACLFFWLKTTPYQEHVHDLTLEIIKMTQDVGKKELLIYYKVTNNSSALKKIPFIKIKLLSKTDKIIESRIFDTKTSIDPSKYVLIGCKFDQITNQIDKADVIIGTKLGLILDELYR
jgi:predicted Zn finger-like uncharacterized protein